MRIGVLNVGSNSAQLQVVDAIAGAPPLPVHALKEPTRLAEEVDADSLISQAGTARVVAGVGRAVSAAHHLDVAHLYAFVTAAIRDADNRESVLDHVEAETGVRLQFLSGEQEARLTYAAVRRWYGWQAGRVLNIDIGGGSMELAFGRDLVPDIAVSLPLGAGRTTREFLDVAVPTTGQVKALRKHVRGHLEDVAERISWEGQPRRVVVTSKTFKQLARLCGAAKLRKGPFVRRTLSATKLAAWVARLRMIPPAERARLRGVSTPRAGQILAGAIVASETLRYLEIDEVELSPWALREGIILEHLAALTDTTELPLQPLHRTWAAASTEATVTTLPTRR